MSSDGDQIGAEAFKKVQSAALEVVDPADPVLNFPFDRFPYAYDSDDAADGSNRVTTPRHLTPEGQGQQTPEPEN